ncbi:hypothetical protein BU26DRAFT_520166 [Trematosphaeria pertusa]|uniref:Uncharacterized protein n=1 Tax=Trematosphaeria pertusa TaxID=390896 RepID=A0A6A6IE53_9PLEO|nr:uncharacterized protein BU26DRAFT_520166 [Trematosphaeria pertusa]KAF2248487.1 hypothetical protein BU26DRAFT_520166 [Trematosphaeria pertusa]
MFIRGKSSVSVPVPPGQGQQFAASFTLLATGRRAPSLKKAFHTIHASASTPLTNSESNNIRSANMATPDSNTASAADDTSPLTVFKRSVDTALSKIPSDFNDSDPDNAEIMTIVDLLNLTKRDDPQIKLTMEGLGKGTGPAFDFVEITKLRALVEVLHAKLSDPDAWSAAAAAAVTHRLHHALANVCVFVEWSHAHPGDTRPHFTAANEVFLKDLLTICLGFFCRPVSLSSSTWDSTVPLFIARLYLVDCPNFFPHEYLHSLLWKMAEAPTLFTEHNYELFKEVVLMVGKRMKSHDDCKRAFNEIVLTRFFERVQSQKGRSSWGLWDGILEIFEECLI